MARPRNPNQSAADLTRTASALAGDMFDRFRVKNALVGADAWHCAFTHPDAGLRGALKVSYPMSISGKVEDRAAFAMLLDHCIASACGEQVQVDEDTQVLVAYKLEYGPPEFKIYSDILFDDLNVASVCLLNESVLAAAGYGENSCVVVDIGARCTRAVPVFENYAMIHCARSTQLGGEHVTELLEQLIDAQGIETYSSSLPRRRQQFARRVKEQHAFVALSFDDAVNRYGQFSFESTKVMTNVVDTSRRCRSASITPHASDIRVSESFVLTDGSDMTISVDRELFYSSEVLFAPFLLEAAQDELNIVDIILSCVEAVDDSVRDDVCRNIVLCGKTSLLQGLSPRLQHDLSRGMRNLGVREYSVVVGEDANIPPSLVWGGADVYISDIDAGRAIGDDDVKAIPIGNIVTSHFYSKTGAKAFADLS